MSESQEGQLQNYSVDQAAGAVVLVLGAVASLLLVIWQSKCHCRMNLCYIFQCERRPPSEDEMKGLADQFTKNEKKEDDILDKEEEILEKIVVDEQLIPPVKSRTPSLTASAPPSIIDSELEYIDDSPEIPDRPVVR
tara:strand:+ start:3086 stop:3496 length:411 start_codon:yes stop_codon:yes gene_type:complete